MDIQIVKFIFYVTSGISLTILLLLIGYYNYRRRYPEKFEQKQTDTKKSKNKKKAQKRKR